MDGLYGNTVYKWMIAGGTPMTKHKPPSIFWFIPPIEMVMTGGWFIIVLNTLDMYIYIYLTIYDH